MSQVNKDYFNEKTLQELIHQHNEVDWLQTSRFAALRDFDERPWPAATDEAWRRTNISNIDFNSYELVNGVQKNRDLELIDTSEDLSGFIRFHGAHVTEARLSNELFEKGVIFMGLADAARRFPKLVQEYFNEKKDTVADAKFKSFNRSFWTHGVFLYVPSFLELSQPFKVVFEESGNKIASLPQILIVLKSGARVNFRQEIVGTDSEEILRNALVHLHVEDAAYLNYVEIQNLNDKSYNFSFGDAFVGRDAEINTLVAVFGSKLTKHYIGSNLTGRGANAKIQGIYFAENRQHLDFQTLQNHQAGSAKSDLLYKGVVKDRAHAVYQGLIKVYPDAQLTDAYQTNRNLLLNDKARADSIPSLEIEANDVKCSHGSTVGKINAEEIFYLMSRGLSEHDARKMVVDGFFEDLLKDAPEDVRDQLRKQIESELEAI